MKHIVKDFILRGMVAAGFGPLALVVFYLITAHHAGLETISVSQVCTGILSLTSLAFIAGGMNVIYQIERLPLMAAITIHGAVLYGSYLATYLINGWLEQGRWPILVFTVIFIAGYLAIWAVIYCITKRRTERINEILKQNQAQ
jgi:branched-subunit amino acid ABC-type transport system permease component